MGPDIGIIIDEAQRLLADLESIFQPSILDESDPVFGKDFVVVRIVADTLFQNLEGIPPPALDFVDLAELDIGLDKVFLYIDDF